MAAERAKQPVPRKRARMRPRPRTLPRTMRNMIRTTSAANVNRPTSKMDRVKRERRTKASRNRRLRRMIKKKTMRAPQTMATLLKKMMVTVVRVQRIKQTAKVKSQRTVHRKAIPSVGTGDLGTQRAKFLMSKMRSKFFMRKHDPDLVRLKPIVSRTSITTNRGNEVSKNGTADDPAVVLDTGKSKAVKLAHELN